MQRARHSCCVTPASFFLPYSLAQGNNRSLPVTARSLETLIRLASAHSKARLSHKVEEADASKAVDLMSFALYHETASSLNEQHDENVDDEDAPRTSSKHRHGAGSDDDEEVNARYVSDAGSSVFPFYLACHAVVGVLSCPHGDRVKGILWCGLWVDGMSDCAC